MLRLSLCASLLLVGMSGQQGAPAPMPIGARLVPGMQLVYVSDGVESPWTVDSVVRDVTIGRQTGCVRIRLRISPYQVNADTRVHCLRDDTMMNADSTGRLQPARPLLAGVSMLIEQPNAGRVQFETLQAAVEQIPVQQGDSLTRIAVDVLPTTVTTFDSSGKVIRRLRENFSVALGTATGGVFEVPDPSLRSGWRVVRRFSLVSIRMPR